MFAQSSGGTNVLRSSGDVWGPYTLKAFITLAYQAAPPLTGQINQGALVNTTAGDVRPPCCLSSHVLNRFPVVLDGVLLVVSERAVSCSFCRYRARITESVLLASRA
jgi:hypothetical protein